MVTSIYKKPKKFAQTTFKYHKYNPKLLRLQEMNRTFQRKPSEPLKSILEKELNLDGHEMDPFVKDDLLETYNGRDTPETPQKKKILTKVGKISQMFTS